MQRRNGGGQLSYAGGFARRWERALVHALEWSTAKPAILWRMRRLLADPPPNDHGFWQGVLDHAGVDVVASDADLRRIPERGPLVVVANHPRGVLDGFVLAALLARRRTDFRILGRVLAGGLHPAADAALIGVPFPEAPDAQRLMLEMRAAAEAHLADGGAIIVFPSGKIAESATAFGPVEEPPWNPFTARLAQRTGATVLPCFLPGRNSRAWQVANRSAMVLRDGLQLMEVRRTMGRPQAPVVGAAITPEEIAARGEGPGRLAAWLREETLALDPQRVGTGTSPR